MSYEALKIGLGHTRRIGTTQRETQTWTKDGTIIYSWHIPSMIGGASPVGAQVTAGVVMAGAVPARLVSLSYTLGFYLRWWPWTFL